MPELPEVETIKRDLKKMIIGQIIQNVQVYDNRVLSIESAKSFHSINGKKINSIVRRGKGIIIGLSEGYFLVVHLRMTGQLIYGLHLKDQGLKETKIVFSLSSGNFLNYNDQRLFGKLSLVQDLNDVKFLKNLGPEPLNGKLTAEWLKDKLRFRTTPIKVLLLDQEFLAGIGNIYASEILFKANIDPRKKARRLTLEQIRSLRESIRFILREAVKFRGTSMRNYRDSAGQEGKFKSKIKVYGREGEKCFQCARIIQRIVQGGRSTFFCRSCQM